MNLEHPDFVFGELIDERAITPTIQTNSTNART